MPQNNNENSSAKMNYMLSARKSSIRHRLVQHRTIMYTRPRPPAKAWGARTKSPDRYRVVFHDKLYTVKVRTVRDVRRIVPFPVT